LLQAVGKSRASGPGDRTAMPTVHPASHEPARPIRRRTAIATVAVSVTVAAGLATSFATLGRDDHPQRSSGVIDTSRHDLQAAKAQTLRALAQRAARQ
jgi:hypothetical protein